MVTDAKKEVAESIASPPSTSACDKTMTREGVPAPMVSQRSHVAVTLIPRPDDDPRDPLNWPTSEKYTCTVVLSFATFAGFTTALAGQLEVGPLAKLYKKEAPAIALQNSASLGGMIVGSVIFFWLSRVFGRQSVMFWSLLGMPLASVWSSLMTRRDQYVLFIVSRGFAGFFGTIVGVLGPRCLIDMFFLHQRGRAYTVFHFAFDLGNTAGRPVCAFAATPSGDWRWAFWVCIILDAVAIALYAAFMHDTTYNRRNGMDNLFAPKGWVASRVATFLPGTRVTPKLSMCVFLHEALTPFKIALTPVTILLSIFTLFNFGFFVAMNAITPAWLQRPEKVGGYGFTPFQNALFQFFHWIGIAVALVYGQLVSDRIPLWTARRYGRGHWKPEYRLHALWLPALACNPLGLGIFGYGLNKHLSWGFLGLSQILVTFGSLCITPITVNYLSECFTNNIEETAIVLNTFRIGFGLSVVFYVNQWVEAVGFSWTYGTMAFIQIFSWFFVMLLLWKGHRIRQWDPFGLICTEEGEHLLIKDD
ncbi:hypothetical protein PWT90_09422 [Aphanocladium album]|nr:hypothetical protein PWT90_09422 [Aphanocladium album]